METSNPYYKKGRTVQIITIGVNVLTILSCLYWIYNYRTSGLIYLFRTPDWMLLLQAAAAGLMLWRDLKIHNQEAEYESEALDGTLVASGQEPLVSLDQKLLRLALSVAILLFFNEVISIVYGVALEVFR